MAVEAEDAMDERDGGGSFPVMVFTNADQVVERLPNGTVPLLQSSSPRIK